MERKIVSGIMLTLFLLISMLTLAFNIQPVKASGTIYIRPDGSIDPPTAPIASESFGTSELVPLLDTFTTVMDRPNIGGWGGPFVIYDAGLYKMWYGAAGAIVYAESNNGITWSNLQTFHNITGSDYRTGSPWIIKENGTYRMWHMDYYEVVAGDWSGYIAHMTSTDGINWPAFMSADDQKVLSAQGQSTPQGDGFHIVDACVIHEPTGYVMWYTVHDHTYPVPGTAGYPSIWRATSTDGIAWSNRQLSLPYVPDTWESNVRHAFVIKEDDGTYTMFYWAVPGTQWDGSCIGITESADGISWTNRRQWLKPSDLSTNITWISEPFHFRDVDGKRYLYFSYYDGKYKLGRIQLGVLPPVDWWPMFQHDSSRIGYSTSQAPNTNNSIWSYTFGDYPVGSPAVVDGKVFVGSSIYDSYFYCLNATTGTQIWNYTAGPVAWGASPAVAYGIVFTGGPYYNVYALNATNGALKWTYYAGAHCWVDTAPAVADGVVFIGLSNVGARLVALNATTGAYIWSFSAPYGVGTASMSSPAVVDGVVFVSSDDDYGNVYALHANNGSVIWKYSVGTQGQGGGSPAVVDGKVFVGSYANGKVYALNATNGVLIWSYNRTGSQYYNSPAVAYGKVFITEWGYVLALNATDGTLMWKRDGSISGGSTPAVADGKVFVGSTNGYVYALNATDGTLIWRYRTYLNLGYSSPAIADGKVFITSCSSVVYKIFAFGPSALHDVAVTNVTPSKSVVGQGYSLNINVTVANQGDYAETFNVTVYANTTSIATQTVTLESGDSTTITFTWNTTGFAKGNYTISAYAWPVPGETDLANNNCTSGTVQITKVGDIGSRVGGTNVFGVCDGLVTSTDLNLFLQCYKATAPASYMYLGDLGSRVGSTNKFFACDGVVTSTDLNLFLQCYKGSGP